MKRLMNRSRGFSLIEIMVALAIGSLLLAGLVATFVNANSNYSQLTQTGRQIESGRYAISVLETDLRHAGFYGEYTGARAVRDPASPPVLAAPLPCNDGPAEFLANLVVPIYGYQGDAAAPLACINNYLPNTDVLVVRRLSTEPEAGALDANTVYFQGYLDPPIASAGPYLAYGPDAPFNLKYPTTLANAIPIRMFIEHIYYIANCRDCVAKDGIPTLTRLDFVGHGKFDVVPLAEGIENMQIRYGIDNSGLNNGSPSSYKVASAMVMDPDWDSVVSVEINLLARNTAETPNYQDKKIYTLGDVQLGPYNDKYRRHAFSEVVRITNAASRKEE